MAKKVKVLGPNEDGGCDCIECEEIEESKKKRSKED